MKQFAVLAIALLLSTFASAQVAGKWVSYSEDDAKPSSHIEIYEQNGKLYGKVIKILRADSPENCQTCSGKYKNKPLVGMVIMNDLVEEDANKYGEGKIYDPESDNTYNLEVWIEDQDPNKLFVRGKHWTGLYRTVEWTRLEE